MTKVVEAMTTNETFFFRDKTPFETFRSGGSAGAFGGAPDHAQHPYLVRGGFDRSGALFAGHGAEGDGRRGCCRMADRADRDRFSNEVLEKARKGIYSQFEVQRGLPIQLLVKYFAQDGEMWQIAPEIRAMVRFQQFNLLSDFSRLGTFDVIFCRNALIYFDKETKIDVLNRLSRVVARDGHLVLGAAETVVGLTAAFKTVPDLRGFYAPNVRPSRLQTVGGERPPPRFAVVNGGR